MTHNIITELTKIGNYCRDHDILNNECIEEGGDCKLFFDEMTEAVVEVEKMLEIEKQIEELQLKRFAIIADPNDKRKRGWRRKGNPAL
jgi:hypothetical protein